MKYAKVANQMGPMGPTDELVRAGVQKTVGGRMGAGAQKLMTKGTDLAAKYAPTLSKGAGRAGAALGAGGKLLGKALGPGMAVADLAMGAYKGATSDSNVRAAKDEEGNVEMEFRDFTQKSINDLQAYVNSVTNPPPSQNQEKNSDDEEEDDSSDSSSSSDSDSDNSDDENQDENVAGLPEKVDSFLVYINDMYFDGQLDITSKNALKQDLNDSEEVPRLIYNSDDVIARSPRFAARKRIIRSQ